MTLTTGTTNPSTPTDRTTWGQKQITWAQKQIALLQLETEREAMHAALLQVELNLRPESSETAYRARDELRRELNQISATRRLVEAEVTKPKRFWSEFTVRLYLWATKERTRI